MRGGLQRRRGRSARPVPERPVRGRLNASDVRHAVLASPHDPAAVEDNAVGLELLLLLLLDLLGGQDLLPIKADFHWQGTRVFDDGDIPFMVVVDLDETVGILFPAEVLAAGVVPVCGERCGI